MRHLARTVLATMRQNTGKVYPSLEKMLPSMSEPQLQDLLRLVRDVTDSENRRCRAQVRRIGLPGVIR